MNIFLKSVVGTLVALIMYLVLAKQGKDISTLLTIAVCCMLGSAAFVCLNPVIDFINRLSEISRIDPNMFQTVLRCVGIGLLSEFVALICIDAGNAALGKSLQLLASCVVLWLSIPIMTRLIDLLEEILQSL